MKYRGFVILGGGEPTLSRHFIPLIRHIKKLYPAWKIGVITNGTLLSKLIDENLNDLQSVSFQISLDGATEATHDPIRGAGSFSKAITSVKKLSALGIDVGTITILSKRTSTEIESFFKLANLLSVRDHSFTRFIELGYGIKHVSEGQDRALLPLELRESYLRILAGAARFKIATNTSLPLFNLIYPSLGRSGRFWEGLGVDHKGNILLTSKSQIILGNVKTDNLEKVFLNHPTLRKLRVGKIKECAGCKFLYSCGGDRNAAYALNGDILGADPGCWININVS